MFQYSVGFLHVSVVWYSSFMSSVIQIPRSFSEWVLQSKTSLSSRYSLLMLPCTRCIVLHLSTLNFVCQTFVHFSNFAVSFWSTVQSLCGTSHKHEICLSSVKCNVGAPYSQVGLYGNIFCTTVSTSLGTRTVCIKILQKNKAFLGDRANLLTLTAGLRFDTLCYLAPKSQTRVNPALA